jgi:hypothetical protein
MIWPWLEWLRHRHEWKQQAEAAERELERSKRLREQDQVLLRPIARAHQRNAFSDMIRDALQVGYEQHNGGRGT